MNVQELIDKLKTMPQDALVYIYSSPPGGNEPVVRVKLDIDVMSPEVYIVGESYD